MKKTNILKDVIIPVFSLFLICIVFTFLLGMTNKATAEKIKDLSLKAEAEARTKVLDTAKSFSDEKEKDGIIYYEGYDEQGEIVGYIFPEQTKGYGGTIYMTVGIDSDGTVHGVEITELSETAGLGMNAKNHPWFLEQFKDMGGVIGVAKNNPAEGEIQALTGATITSKAVTLGVNTAIESFNEITGGENNG
jgi:electron transport complex protein RnfG